MSKQVSAWPKSPPPLSLQQEQAREEFMMAWHEALPTKYGLLERFNHGSIAQLPAGNAHFRTLEIGAGIGGHLPFEDLSRQEYHCLEYRAEFCDRLRELDGVVDVQQASIEERTPYADAAFDRIIAIHVLEHLRNLPAALIEIDRIVRPGGIFDVVLPCEGSAAYWLARKISAERMFESRFHMKYKPIIANEHVNTIFEILPLLSESFRVVQRKFFPLLVPLVATNLIIALRLEKR